MRALNLKPASKMERGRARSTTAAQGLRCAAQIADAPLEGRASITSAYVRASQAVPTRAVAAMMAAVAHVKVEHAHLGSHVRVDDASLPVRRAALARAAAATTAAAAPVKVEHAHQGSRVRVDDASLPVSRTALARAAVITDAAARADDANQEKPVTAERAIPQYVTPTARVRAVAMMDAEVRVDNAPHRRAASTAHVRARHGVMVPPAAKMDVVAPASAPREEPVTPQSNAEHKHASQRRIPAQATRSVVPVSAMSRRGFVCRRWLGRGCEGELIWANRWVIMRDTEWREAC